jgi:predicted dehydrogenase/threonine dehydrogenase-like Zn-dependent dehydrogenase
MRQVFLEKGVIAVKEVCQPELDDHSVLVTVHYSCISSGTEAATISNASTSNMLKGMPQKIKKVLDSLSTHGVEGTKALIKGRLAGTVLPLGYSCSGRVVAVGRKVKKFKSGDFVACAGAGFASHADMVVVPENLVVGLKDEQSLRHASLTTIGAIALQGLRRADVQLGDTVCVLGLGLLGQITVQLAKLSGCKVIGIDIVPERLALAKELGADVVLHGQENNVQKEIEFLTQHYGVDVTLITAASSSHDIVQQAMQVTRRKGKVVLVGDVGLNLERSPFYQKEIDFLISCSYGPGRYDAAYEQQGNDYPYAYVRWTENRNMQAVAQLIEQGKVRIEPFVHEFSVDNAQQAYESVQQKKSLAAILSYLPKNEKVVVPEKKLSFRPAVQDKTRVGFVGAGGFAKFKLIPIVSKFSDAKINAIVDADIATAINVSRTYGAAKALGTDQELFTEDMVDLVVIASPHKFHCDQSMRALEQGKAVFVEKPMATDFAQFAKISSYLKKHDQAPFCVDYNRSFAPFMLKIKKAVEQRSSPMVVHYRMNAGFIPKDHWVQTDIGAGRIIGEACHIFDLFCFLTDAKPVSVSVETIRPSNDDLFATDNFSAHISFADGSVCSLLYTSLGHNNLGKERMELFFDSKSIVMDDYLTLQGYGLPKSFNESVSIADKGHEDLMRKFFESVKHQKPAPITFDRLNTVAELTLIIDQLACQGGGAREIGS